MNISKELVFLAIKLVFLTGFSESRLRLLLRLRPGFHTRQVQRDWQRTRERVDKEGKIAEHPRQKAREAKARDPKSGKGIKGRVTLSTIWAIGMKNNLELQGIIFLLSSVSQGYVF